MSSFPTADYKKYNSKNPFTRLAIRCFLNSVAGLIKNILPRDILDAGCGEGFVIRYIRNRYRDAAVTCIDDNRQVLFKAQALNPGQDFIQASIYQLPFRDKSFDLLISLEVLEHLVSVDAALAELKRVTRRHCLLSIPYEPYFSICRFLGGKDVLRLGRHREHVNYFKISQMQEKLKSYFTLEKTVISFPWVIFWGTVK